MLNQNSLDTVCAALACAMGIEPPAQSSGPNETLVAFVNEAFGGQKADRVVMYNPDAIAQWIYEKYPEYLTEVNARAQVKIPLRTVMPSVTPVCFGTMYTGAQPEVHGIRSYQKPVIKIETLFDAVIRAGKKPVIIADSECSIGKIFLERKMDYFIFDTLAEVNAKAAEVILEDKYDLVVIYNGNYDAVMHRFGTEDPHSLAALACNDAEFAQLDTLIRNHWQSHNTLLGFAMDHGCHDIDGGCGSHGLDMEEDLNIVHCYTAHPRKD